MTDPDLHNDVSEAARQASMGSRRAAPRSPKEAIEPTPAPPPPPRLKLRHRPFVTYGSNFFTLLLILIALAGAGAYVFVNSQSKPGPLTEDKVLVVRGGTWDIADQLEQAGVISDPYSFLFAVMTSTKGDKLKAGEYLFKQQASVAQVVATLAEGKSILHSVTIPEGLTSEQIVARLMDNEILTGDIREVPAEGSLLPDTYRVERGMQRQQMVARMQDAQRRMLSEIFAKRASDNPVKTARELVIMASIVEKETGRADERTRVAGVFINRLNKRMRLQSDPTIVYGLVGGKGTLGRGITRDEINRATPYNTYVIEGLPPGPIANPGRAAMEAVANPSRTNDLFFVADGTGGHAFAESLEQHNRNVTRWRQLERSRPATSDQPKPVDRFEDDSVAPAAPPRRSDIAPVPGDPVTPAMATGSIDAPASAANFAAQPRRGVTDATEGTAKDPLKFKNFDLNSTQIVPKIRR